MNTGEIAEMLDRLDLAEILHDAGEQPRPPPVRLRGTRVLACSCRALACGDATPPGTVGVGRPRACCLPSGFYPSVPKFHQVSQPRLRPGRGLSPPVRSFTDPGARLFVVPNYCAIAGIPANRLKRLSACSQSRARGQPARSSGRQP